MNVFLNFMSEWKVELGSARLLTFLLLQRFSNFNVRMNHLEIWLKSKFDWECLEFWDCTFLGRSQRMPVIQVHGPHSKYSPAAVLLKQKLTLLCQNLFHSLLKYIWFSLTFFFKEKGVGCTFCKILLQKFSNIKKSWKIFILTPPPRLHH